MRPAAQRLDNAALCRKQNKNSRLLVKIGQFFNTVYVAEKEKAYILTHNSPAMPFGNRKIYFRGSFQFGIVTI